MQLRSRRRNNPSCEMSRRCVIVLLSIVCLLTWNVHAMNIELVGGIERASQYALSDMTLAYKLVDPSVTVNNVLMEESVMIDQLISNKLDFGISISGLDYATHATFPTLRIVPLVLTGLAPIYSLKSINDVPLILPSDVLVSIYDGDITNWQAPEIQYANPTIAHLLPDKPITIVLEEGANPKYTIMKTAFAKFSGIPTDANAQNSWPYGRYASYRTVPASTTMLVSTVIAHDGALAISCHAIAVALGAQIARMVNKARYEVEITPDSLSLAAMELATGTGEITHQVLDLTDASNPGAWPMTMFAYLVVSTTQSRATCKARETLVKYFDNFYQSPVMNAMLSDRKYAPVPVMLYDRLGITELRGQVECRGQKVVWDQDTPDRIIGTSQQNFVKARLMSAVYLNVDPTFQFKPLISTDELMVSQLLTSELDVALINPYYVNPKVWDELSNEFLVLPLYAQAITYFVNPMLRADPYFSLSSSMTIAETPQAFVLDSQLLTHISLLCGLSDFNDERILSLNPWMRSILGGQSIPITFVAPCGDNAPSMVRFMTDKNVATSKTSVGRCLDPTQNQMLAALQYGYSTCVVPDGLNVRLVSDENKGPAIASGTAGAITGTVMDGDPAKLFVHLNVTNGNGASKIIAPGLDSVLACASNSYDSTSKWFNLEKTSNLECWPYTQMTTLVVRKQYWSGSNVVNASSCVRGLDALRFARWLVSTNDLDSVTEAEHSVNLIKTDPRVRGDYIAALEAALCDDDTLLITLPVIWEITPAFKGFGIALAAIGMAFTTCHILFSMYYSKHTAIRSASLVLLLTSLFGVLMMFACVLALLQPASNQTCSVVQWLFDVGVTFAFVPLLAKVYRVYKISSGRKLQAVKSMNNRRLSLVVICLIIVELAFVLSWQIVSPLQPITKTVWEGTPSVEYRYTQCSTRDEGDQFFIATLLLKGFFLVVGAMLAFRTRKQSSTQFNEPAQVSFALYNACFTLTIIGAIFGVIAPQGDVAIALLFLVAIWISFVTASLLGVPKMLAVWTTVQDPNKSKQTDATTTVSSTGFTFLSLDVLSSLPVIGTYMTALRRHLEAAEARQAALQRAQTQGSPSSQLVNSSSTLTRRIEARSPLTNKSVLASCNEEH